MKSGHRMLQDVHDLAAVVEMEACLYLPARVQKQTVWTSVLTVLPLCLMGYIVLIFRWPLLATEWWVIVLCLFGAAAVLRWHVRRSTYSAYWILDITKRRLESVEKDVAPIQLGASHSIGCHSGPLHHGVLTVEVELRHRTSGPVATLCSVDMPTSLKSNLATQLEILDKCVDRLVHRLEIRRSGARLVS